MMLMSGFASAYVGHAHAMMSRSTTFDAIFQMARQRPDDSHVLVALLRFAMLEIRPGQTYRFVG